MTGIACRIAGCQVSHVLFASALALEVFSQCLGTSEIPQVYGVGSLMSAMKLAAVYIALAKIVLFTKYELHELAFSLTLLCASTLSWWYSGSDYVLMMSLFVVAAKDIDYTLICKTAAACCLACVVLVVTMSIIGVLPNAIQERSYSFGLVVERRLFGFQHVNFLGGYVLLSALCILYLRRSKIRIWDYIVLGTVAIILYLYVNTKTSAALLAMTAVLLFLAQYRLSGKPLIVLCLGLIIGSVTLSFLLPSLYQTGSQIMRSIDELSSLRLSFGAMFLRDYPITPFGQELELVSSIEASKSGHSMSVLDNTYLHLLLRFGLAPFLMYIGMYAALIIKAIRNNDLTLLVLCTSVLVCGIAEKWGFMLGYNVVLLALFANLSSTLPKTSRLRVIAENGRRTNSVATV